MHRNELSRMTEYAMKAVYYRIFHTLKSSDKKAVFKMSPILILNTNAKLLPYILPEGIKEWLV